MSTPAYGLIEPHQLAPASRRRFLQAGALMLGFVWMSRQKAWAAEPLPTGQPSIAPFTGFQPNAFIRIAPTGRIGLIIPATEMGQGIYTGQATLIAEELEVGLDQIEVIAAPPNDKLYASPILKSQATGGSTSIRGAWMPLRQAGAAARTMLVEAAAQRWNVRPEDCYAERGVVHNRLTEDRLTYGALAGAASGRKPPETVQLKPRSQFKLIGRSLQRVETPAKVNGTAQFGIDANVEGMKIAAVAYCPAQGGKLASIDDSRTRAIPGVLEVLKIDDAVAVVADHYWTAKKGVDALQLRWDLSKQADASSDAIWAALKQASEKGKPLPAKTEGDPDKAMADAATKLDAVYESPFLAHATMEPMNATVQVRGDQCEIWLGTQAPTRVQSDVAQALGIPAENIVIHNHVLGGGFGRRLVGDTVVQAALFAKQVPYPLKVIQTREQDIRLDHFRPGYYDRIAAGLDKDGMPMAWTHRITGASVLGSYLPTGFPEGVLDTDAVESAAETPYDFPTKRVDWVRQDAPVKVNWWRGVGATHNVFVVESFLDECAHAAGKDPVAYRRALLGKNPRAKAVLDLAAAKSGWGESLPARSGRGIALSDAFGSHVALVCQVAVAPSGEVKLERLVAAVDCGTAINPNTVKAQIEGGVVFGLSAALYSGITFTGGAVDQGNFNDYRMMRINEVPPFETYVVASDADPGGIGEVGTAAAAAALANAIFAATGIRLRKLPLETQALAQKGNDQKVAAGIAVPLAIGAGALLWNATGDAADKEAAE